MHESLMVEIFNVLGKRHQLDVTSISCSKDTNYELPIIIRNIQYTNNTHFTMAHRPNSQ
jgi:hypothetical protein